MSCYYMMTTLVTVGYGDKLPSCVDEFAMIVVIMVCCIAIFGYIMGSVNAELKQLEENEKRKTNTDKLLQLDFWMDKIENKRKLTSQFKQKVFNHFLYYWKADRLVGMSKKYWKCSDIGEMLEIDDPFLSKLDVKLLDNIMKYIFGDIFYFFR